MKPLVAIPTGTELIVVMPIYNEEGNIESVLRDWSDALINLGVPSSLLPLNDGFTDRTPVYSPPARGKIHGCPSSRQGPHRARKNLSDGLRDFGGDWNAVGVASGLRRAVRFGLPPSILGRPALRRLRIWSAEITWRRAAPANALILLHLCRGMTYRNKAQRR